MSTMLSRNLARRAPAVASPDRWLALQARCGQLAGLVLLAAILILDRLDPNVAPLADPVSYLGARGALYAPAMNTALALSGLLLAVFALGLQRALRPLPLRWQPVISIGLFGAVGLLGAALLPCDFHCYGGSLAGKLHYLPAVLGVAFLLAGLWSLPLHLSLDPHWSAYAAWPPRLLQAGLALTALFQLGGWRIVPALHPYVGLFQRLFLLAVFAASYAAAGHLRRLAPD